MKTLLKSKGSFGAYKLVNYGGEWYEIMFKAPGDFRFAPVKKSQRSMSSRGLQSCVALFEKLVRKARV